MPKKASAPLDLALAMSLLRQVKGLKQKELAASSGISLSSIKSIEGGFRQPGPTTLARLASTLGVDAHQLAEVLALISRLRGSSRSLSRDCFSPQGDRPLDLGTGFADDLARLLLAADTIPPAGEVAALTVEDSRCRAPALWERIEALPQDMQRVLICEATEFQTPGLCELLCAKSLEATGDNAERATYLAGLAILVAERSPGEDDWRSRLLGYSHFHLANALRVGQDLQMAEEELARARHFWEAGAAGDPGLLNEARVLGIEASWRRDLRQFPEALNLLDRALAVDCWNETPSLRIAKSDVLASLRCE